MRLLLILSLLILPLQAQIPSLKQLSNLVNPQKLSSLKKGNRSGNPRFKKLMYWICIYEKQGTKPKVFLNSLYSQFSKIRPYSNALHVYAPVTEKLNLEAQYRLGKLYGLYTPSNLAKLRRGNAALITKGKFTGEKIEIDHLIPYSKAPSLENSMANLTWLPRSVNRAKSAKYTNAAKRRARALEKEVGWKMQK